MRYILAIAAWLMLALGSIAQTPGTVTLNGMPYGRGPGVSTFGTFGPCTSTQAVIWPSGTGAPPACGALSSAGVNNTQPGTGGLTRTALANFSDVVNLKNFAPGDGTDQTTAVQAAFTYAKSLGFPTVFVPCGIYLVTTTIDITGIGVTGLGGCSAFTTTANTAILKDNNDTTTIAHVTRENFALASNNATHTLDYGWTLTGTTVGNSFSYNTFRGIQCYGVKACLYFNKNVNSGGENQHDWNTITNIQATNNGANQTDYGVLFQNGSGTGNIITNSNLVVGKAGVEYVATNGANVGDIVISGLEIGGLATDGCLVFPAAASYRSNISIVNNQCDGGPTLSIVATNYNGIKSYGNNFGGATTTSLSGTVGSPGDFGEAQERRYGQQKTVASTGTNAFFSVTLPNATRAAVMVELVVSGLVQASGIQIRTSRYHITEDGACAGITATEIDTQANGAGTQFTITTALATCTLTFSTSFPGGTTANSVMSYHARVAGALFDAAMQ